MRTERLLVRLDPETKRLLQQLSERQGTSLSEAVRLAIREVGWRRGLSAYEGDLFTERARRVLQASDDEAAARRETEIRPAHLLLALLAVPDARATLILGSLGIDIDRAYEIADERAGRGPGPASDRRGVSSAGKRAIERAVAEANRLGHHYVGTEHLLLGLLQEDTDGVVAPTFERLGVTVETVRATIELYKERLARVFP